MHLRAYEDRDRDAVVALSLRAWAPVFSSLESILGPSGVFEWLHPDWRVSQQQAVVAACSAEDNQASVAEADALVVGFVVVHLHREASVGEISMLAVDPSHQRNGIGSLLTTFALDQIKKAGMAVAMVETGGDPGHAPARQTYEHAGFVELPVSRYFKRL